MSTEARRQPIPPQEGEQLRFPEPFGVKPNSFADFVASPTAQAYIDATRELQHESSAWQNSNAYKAMREEGIKIYMQANPTDSLAKATQHVNLTTSPVQLTTGNKRKYDKFSEQNNPAIDAIYGGPEERKRIHKPIDDYLETAEPIIQILDALRTTLGAEYAQYLKEHFFEPDLIDFIEKSSKNELFKIKPILEMLTDDVKKVAGETATFLAQEKERIKIPNKYHLGVYVEKIRDQAKTHPSWALIALGLKAAGQDPNEVATEKIVEQIMSDPNQLTEEFIVGYRQRLLADLQSQVSRMRIALEPFQVKSATVELPPTLTRSGRSAVKIKKEYIKAELIIKSPEEEIIEPHTVAVFKQGREPQPMDIRALTEYIEDVARKFARGDIRVVSDIQAMIDSLVNNPYGPGTKRLTGKELKIRIENKELALRRFDPGNTERNLDLQHEYSKHIRIAYAVIPQANMVAIDAIVGHDDFNMKYSV